MLKNISRLSVVFLSCILISCSVSKSGTSASAAGGSTSMGTTNTGNALQPLELVSGPGIAPVTGSDGTPIVSTVKLIASYAADYDPTIGSSYCQLQDYAGQSYCQNNACALQTDPNLHGLNPQNNQPYNMCARDACMTDAAQLGGTISIASDASTSPAPSGQCVTNGSVYFLKITVYANYDREYFVSPALQPMAASGSDHNSCLGRMGHFSVSSFVDMGSLTSPADTGLGYVRFFCAESSSNPNMGSFTIQYCKDSVSCTSD